MLFQRSLLRVTSMQRPIATSLLQGRGLFTTTHRSMPYANQQQTANASNNSNSSKPTTEQDWVEALDEGAEAKEAIRAFKEDNFVLGVNNQDSQINVIEPLCGESTTETVDRIPVASFES